MEIGSEDCDGLIKLILMSFGMTLSLILEYISVKKQKNLHFQQNSNYDFFNPKLIVATFFLVILDLASCFLINRETNTPEQSQSYFFYGKDELFIMVQFFSVAFFSFLFKKLIMFRHHIFFTCLMILGLISIIISNLPNLNITADLDFISLFVSSILWGVLNVTEKYLMDNKYASPYLVVGYEGFFGFLLSLISFFVKCFVINKSGNQCEISKFKNSGFIIQAIVYVVSSFVYNVLTMLIIQHYAATNRIVCDFFSFTSSVFINEIFNLNDHQLNYKSFYLFLILGHFLVLFGVLGFNEIIILHCCNFEINTIKFITERATKEEFMKDELVLVEKKANFLTTDDSISDDEET